MENNQRKIFRGSESLVKQPQWLIERKFFQKIGKIDEVKVEFFYQCHYKKAENKRD